MAITTSCGGSTALAEVNQASLHSPGNARAGQHTTAHQPSQLPVITSKPRMLKGSPAEIPGKMQHQQLEAAPRCSTQHIHSPHAARLNRQPKVA